MGLDREGDFSRVGVQSQVEGPALVRSARGFVDKVLELRGAGLNAKAAFLLL